MLLHSYFHLVIDQMWLCPVCLRKAYTHPDSIREVGPLATSNEGFDLSNGPKSNLHMPLEWIALSITF